ncbi:MAG: polymerase subunit gamma/tau [Proteobacteria bacterium]|nr:polymerase subunit gamma/tau [Pseudomonadota bacterium]
MSYLVLARKWRPRRFDEMVGQEHVLRALVNALDSGRVHHAFLFTGTRGVGKTTIARILAKSLNCEKGVTSTPCGECAACREIDEGRFVDLIEVDAASRTKVDDTRELLDNVQYSPTRGRYKVYLIDEVHMLSGHSFNALLKTLEEPPPHVKFLLATTDPQKLPATVLSRCLQFSLKRLSPSLIGERLRYILDEEGVAFEPAAIRLLSRAADGSLRDGLSLLDQMLAFGGGRVAEADARTMLGTIDRGFVTRLLDRLADRDAAGLMACVAAIDEQGPDYAQVLDELASLLQKVALRQAVPDLPADEVWGIEELDGFASRIAPEDLQLYYQMAILGRRDLPLAPEPRGGLEMVLLRMLAFVPAAGPPAEAGRPAEPRPAARRSAPPGVESAPRATSPGAPAQPVPDLDLSDWRAVVDRLGLQAAARQLASHLNFVALEGDVLRLALDARGEVLRTRLQEERLAQAVSGLAGRPIRLQLEVSHDAGRTPAREKERERQERLEQARLSIENDPTVQALKDRFGAVVQPDSIKPVG